MRRILTTLTLAFLSSLGLAQHYTFKELKQTYIKGAPRLTTPRFLTVGNSFMQVGKVGHAAPLVYDWDRDGKMDILVGEFEIKKSYLKLFRNIGTNKKPIYEEDSTYVKNSFGETLYINGS